LGCVLLGGCLLGKTDLFYEGRLQGKPVEHPVTVLRDAQGIPHIYAENAGDLFFGLGYVMAQDRLFQMDLYRHVAQGRLTEWFGNPRLGTGVRLVQFDMLLKCFEIPQHTRDALKGMSEESRGLLERFTEGINQLIADREKRLPVEYRLLHIEAEPWSAADVMSIPEVFGVGLAFIGVGTEIFYAAMEHAMGEERTKDFFRRISGWEPPDASGAKGVSRGAGHGMESSTLFQLGRFFQQSVPQGSNNWVVSGARSESGSPLLANDPHVPLGIAPNFWYHAHLEGDGFSVAGLLYPGYPAFGAGWNGKTAWGVTNIMADQMDLVREMLDPETQETYLTPDGWRRFEKKEILCKVRWGRDQTFQLKKGLYGFLLPPEALKNAYTRKYPWLLDPLRVRYVETRPADYFEGQILLMRSENGGELIKALKKIGKGPTAYNYVWAASDGDIGYHAAGRIPIRPDGVGYRPKEGWEHAAEWRGMIPFDELPSLTNPPDGVFQSANERIAPPDYPWYITTDYARSYRSRRIRQLLLEKETCSAEAFKKIQSDVYNLAAPSVLEILGDVLRDEEVSEGLKPLGLEARDLLEDWDLQTTADSAGTVLFEVFYQRFIENTFADEMGKDLAGPALKSNLVAAKVMDTLLHDPDNPWFDRQGTARIEGRDDVMASSFQEAVRFCRKRMGRDPKKWSWGRIHTLYMGHPLGLVPLIGKPYRIGTMGYPGDNDTVNGGYFLADKKNYKVFAGAASRFIVDFGKPEGAWFNCSTGMGGEPASAFFKNLNEGWQRNEYFRTERVGDPALLPAEKRLVLEP